jgi:hypothetical protein
MAPQSEEKRPVTKVRPMLERLILACLCFLVLNAVIDLALWFYNGFRVPCWILAVNNLAWTVAFLGVLFWKWT